MENLEIIRMIIEHPCPYCGHKIKEHTDYNPYYNNPEMPDGIHICSASHKELLIQKLLAWYQDALSERDAYKKSYEDLLKDLLKEARA